jgi:hypothetical protein
VKNVRHIIRLFVVLAIGGAILLVVRNALIPPTFGQYGSYVGSSLEVIRNKPVQYVGSERCKDCHKNEFRKWAKKGHATVSCEVCHGPGAEHSVENVDPRPLPPRSQSSGKMAEQAHDLCMSCHAKAPGRAPDFPQIQSKLHLAEFKITEQSDDFEESTRCLTCHPGHSPIK